MKVSRLSRVLVLLLVFLLTVFMVSTLFARAGGGGGRSSSSGGGEGIGALVYLIIRLVIYLPFPINIIVIGLIIVLAIWIAKKSRQRSVLNQLPTGKTPDSIRGYKQFLEQNPTFNEAAFKETVKNAFLQIQNGWAAKDISTARKWLSDGVYQRFTTQFRMMNELKQTNTLENIQVKNVYIDKIEQDGLFDIIHVAIQATIVDRFICELDSSLNSGGKEEFVEYWSFLRKRGIESKDLFSSSACPNCGAELPASLGEVSKCEYCGTLLNSGEYDWVLSEITQADDYIGVNKKFTKTQNLTNRVAGLVQDNEDFSMQLIEDKASNGFLQILTAYALQDATVMRRFVSDAAFAKLEKKIPQVRTLYNRIYLNNVSLLGVRDEGKKNVLLIAIRYSSQRVEVDGKKLTKLEDVVVARSKVIVMEREKGAVAGKGSLYTHNCPSCGAACENSLNIKCEYCGSALNSPKHEWIIGDVLSMPEYEAYMAEHAADFTYKVNPSLLDKAYDVRDFALNNVMVMIAADGKFEAEEEQFATEMARKYGFSVKQLAPMFEMAKQGRLVIKMPEDRKQRERIYKLMVKAANADNEVAPEEQKLLDAVKAQFLPENEEGGKEADIA